jgi:transcription antitermination factor NusG
MEIIKSTLNWYVLYTHPRNEKKVKERLEQKQIECWLPVHHAPRQWSDRIKMVDVPLFKSYVFVKCTIPVLNTLHMVYGVSHVVYYNEKPATIKEREITAIKEFLDIAKEKPLLEGEEAEILVGAMKKLSGVVRKIKKKYVVLYIEQLGATVSISLDAVAPASRLL